MVLIKLTGKNIIILSSRISKIDKLLEKCWVLIELYDLDKERKAYHHLNGKLIDIKCRYTLRTIDNLMKLKIHNKLFEDTNKVYLNAIKLYKDCELIK